MSNLQEDLLTYANETWTKRDIRAGLKLLGELAGIAGIATLSVTILTSWVPGLQAIGIPISTALASRLLARAASNYTRISTEERATVRKAIRFLKLFP